MGLATMFDADITDTVYARAKVTGSVFATSGFLGGERITVAYDRHAAALVTFALADSTPVQVAAAINAALADAIVTTPSNTHLVLTGLLPYPDGKIILADVDVGTLAAIGLTPGETDAAAPQITLPRNARKVHFFCPDVAGSTVYISLDGVNDHIRLDSGGVNAKYIWERPTGVSRLWVKSAATARLCAVIET